jgi:hypothetical protein
MTDAMEPGYTYQEWVEECKATHARLAKIPAKELPRGVEKWDRIGHKFLVKVIARRKLAGYQVSIGRGIESPDFYFIRVRGEHADTSAGFPRSIAKNIYRKIKTKTFWQDIKDILP